MTTTLTLDELREVEDLDLGASDWRTVDQATIDRFADATGDHQWIHVDAEKAAEGPFGTTIAHGFLTVSLLPELLGSLWSVTGTSMAMNYGMNKLRLTAPVPSGSRIRATARIVGAEEKGGGVLATLDAEVEVEGSDRPAVIAQFLVLLFG